MAAIPRLNVKMDENSGTVIIRNELLPRLQMTGEELLEVAKDNTEGQNLFEVNTLLGTLINIMQEEGKDIADDFSQYFTAETPRVVVLSNKDRLYMKYMYKFEYLISGLTPLQKDKFFHTMIDCFAVDCQLRYRNITKIQENMQILERYCNCRVSQKCKLKMWIKRYMAPVLGKIYDYKYRKKLSVEEKEFLESL